MMEMDAPGTSSARRTAEPALHHSAPSDWRRRRSLPSLALATLALVAGCARADPPAADGAGPIDLCAPDLAVESLSGLDAAQLDSLLAAVHAAVPRYQDRLRWLAATRLGTPYALGTLGEESPDDPDPLFRTDEADCTVLVLTTAAMASARNVGEARAWMGPANYHRRGDGFPAEYRNRLHFTADRLHASPLFRDVTAEVAGPHERRTVRLTLNRRDDGTELLPLDWSRAIEIDYVPAEQVGEVLGNLPPVAGIAFVRQALFDKGLIVAHEGFLFDGRCLVHASSTAGEVVAVDLLDYLLRRQDADVARRGTPLFDGAIFYTFTDPAESELPPGWIDE